jgi:serine protease AprX
MRKTFYLSMFFLTVVVCKTSGAMPANDSKLDDVLKQKRLSASTNMVRVIVQTVNVPAQSHFDTVTRLGGKVRKTFKHIAGFTAEVPESALAELSTRDWVKRISFDSTVDVKGQGQRDRDNDRDRGRERDQDRGHDRDDDRDRDRDRDDDRNRDRSREHDRDAAEAALSDRSNPSLGKGVGVAVIDSGIARVPNFIDNVLYSVDFTQRSGRPAEDDETDGRNDGRLRVDPLGHGTYVAGVIAGDGKQLRGQYGGIAQRAHLINLRVLDAAGSGRTEDVISAIEWAIDNKDKRTASGQRLNIRVINLSLGHRPVEDAESDPLAAMCRVAVQHGIVVVVAAGNYGKAPNGGTVYGGITSPGIEPSVITVGAMNTWDTLTRADDSVASYSSRGPTPAGIIKPDIVAPGTAFVSTAAKIDSTLVERYPSLYLDRNRYMKLTGTSMAAPVVSGAVAAILGKNPDLTPNAVKALLMYTSERRPESPLEVGAGYINFPGALDLAANVKASAPVNSYWLTHNGARIPHTNTIRAHTIVWSETIVWDELLMMGNMLAYNQPAWSQTIVWGETTVNSWTVPVTPTATAKDLVSMVSGQTIVWDTLLSMAMPWRGQTIVWDELLAFSTSIYTLYR